MGCLAVVSVILRFTATPTVVSIEEKKLPRKLDIVFWMLFRVLRRLIRWCCSAVNLDAEKQENVLVSRVSTSTSIFYFCRSFCCLHSFFVIGAATTRKGDASACGAVAACWLGATALRIRTGPGLFLGMFQVSSPYKAANLGGWWKVGYQRLQLLLDSFASSQHLPGKHLDPLDFLKLAVGFQRRGFSLPLQSFTLGYFLVTLSCATLPSPVSLHSVLLPSPHLFYIINEGTEDFARASHQHDFDRLKNEQ